MLPGDQWYRPGSDSRAWSSLSAEQSEHLHLVSEDDSGYRLAVLCGTTPRSLWPGPLPQVAWGGSLWNHSAFCRWGKQLLSPRQSRVRGEPESSSTSHLIPQPLSHKSLKNQQGVEKLKLNTERGLELQLVCGPWGEQRDSYFFCLLWKHSKKSWSFSVEGRSVISCDFKRTTTTRLSLDWGEMGETCISVYLNWRAKGGGKHIARSGD